MGAHYLEKLFNPNAVAVIGASDKPNSVGQKVFSNLLNGHYSGKLYAVNPKHKEIQGITTYPSIKEIAGPVDLAVITTPATIIPHLITECGEKGVKTAIIISAGFSETGNKGKELEQSCLKLANHYGIRLLGPNCLGMMRPHQHLNITFDNNFAIPGKIALVSQSGAICAAILDWSLDKQIGFSTIVSLGNAIDLDFGEILDFLALDPKTKSILLYIEGIHHTRRFMSGLRSAARLKPVIVIKSGRNQLGHRAVHSHTGALVGDDDVFDAALHRAGAVRVSSIEDLFSAAKILSTDYRTKGNRLAIITNGGGAGVMASDRASELKLILPKLSDEMTTKLNKILPAQWSHQNPIDIIGDATPKRYHQTLELLVKDQNIDAIVVILVPVAMTDPLEVAKQVIQDAKTSKKIILPCWMGEKNVRSSHDLFAANGIPCFNTPEEAIEAFSYLADYHHNQELLLQVPTSLSPQPKPDITGARLIIESVLSQKRKVLTTIESKAILTAFGIPVTQTILAHTANEALVAAESLQYPVVMKINSPDIIHKQEVQGVETDISSADLVRTIFNKIMGSAKAHAPNANILGVTVEKMCKNPNNREVMIGVIADQVFGPVIAFGLGGSFVEIIHDRAIELPPLNQYIAKNLLEQTHASKLLQQFRNMPPVNIDALINILLRVSEMVCELPYIKEMDINPLIVNNETIVAVDARIVVDFPKISTIPYSHMAICPYPSHLISSWQLADGTNITIRPIRPEDAKIEKEFVHKLSAQSKYFRFMEDLQELTPTMLVRFTQIDYDREMAFISTITDNGQEVHVGVARYIINPDQTQCEFALVVADEWQGRGIGTRLMSALIDEAIKHGVKMISGEILSNNHAMLELVQKIGFTISPSEDPNIRVANKVLS